MVQGRLCVVCSTEDELTVVLREAAAAAAPHLRRQDPRYVGLGSSRGLLLAVAINSSEGQSLLIVRGPSGRMGKLLKELLERPTKVREVADGAPFDIAREEVELSKSLLLPSLDLLQLEDVRGKQRHPEV